MNESHKENFELMQIAEKKDMEHILLFISLEIRKNKTILWGSV